MPKNFIDFTPARPQEIPSQFKSNNTILAEMDTSLTKVNTAIFSQATFNTDSGKGQRYDYLKYELEHSTGNYLTIINKETESTLYLFSKLGEQLSKVSIPNRLPAKNGATNKYLFLNSQGDLVWGSPAGEYFAGVAIRIDSEHNISLLYDEDYFKIVNGKLTLNLDKIALKEDLENKQNKLTAINGLELSNETNIIKTLFDIEDSRVEF